MVFVDGESRHGLGGFSPSGCLLASSQGVGQGYSHFKQDPPSNSLMWLLSG